MSAAHVARNDWMTRSPVAGLVALVVGGGSGIGQAAAQMLAANGARVVVADRDEAAAQRVADAIAASGGDALAMACDIGEAADVDALVRRIADAGSLDILVNTAAFVRQAPLAEATQGEWRQTFRVNVEGALRLAAACLPLLKRSASAAIVHVASLAGVHGFPRGGAYGPSKAALITLTRQMGLEWARYGVRANVVIPGLIDTPMSRGAVSPAVRARREAAIPMRRLGQPEEVARLIVYLASPAASYLTSETYVCDGGLSQSLFMASFDDEGRDDAPAPVAHAAAPNWMRNSPVAGLTTLVVGGGSGMGEATARTLAANGGRVVVADRSEANALAVASDIGAGGGAALGVALDIADPAACERAVAAAVGHFGGLDGMVNTAALVRPQPLESASTDDWAACFDVNVEAGLMLSRACLPHLRLSRAAAIVHVGSLGGVWGRPNGGAYGPSKAALMTLSRQMALEWARWGVRVNAVTPGTIDTPLARATVPADVLQARAAEIPMGRLGTSQEMADLIVFLLSPAASYVTAQVFNCDGGHAQSMFFVPMGVGQSTVAVPPSTGSTAPVT